TAVTRVDAGRGEVSHGDPQFLPRGRVLFSIAGNAPDGSGTYAASLANPTERIKVVDGASAMYAPGTDGTDYLVWQRAGTLMAQAFDVATLKVIGEPRVLATEGDDSRLLFSVSGNGVLAYGVTRALSQFNWVDRTGKVLSSVGEPGRTFMFRLSPDER